MSKILTCLKTQARPEVLYCPCFATPPLMWYSCWLQRELMWFCGFLGWNVDGGAEWLIALIVIRVLCAERKIKWSYRRKTEELEFNVRCPPLLPQNVGSYKQHFIKGFKRWLKMSLWFNNIALDFFSSIKESCWRKFITRKLYHVGEWADDSYELAVTQ